MRTFISKTLITASVCVLATSCLLTASRDAADVAKEAPLVPAVTASPELPENIKFADKKYDLRRYNMHEGIDRELTAMTYLHSSTMLLIKRANRWFPVIEPLLKEAGIPDDFKYLAVIESNLDPNAVSPAKAVGMWQLLESTAKGYGLTVNSAIDERRNVKLATQAACRFLNVAYSKYGDWLTAALAYNAGMGRMSEQIEAQNADSPLNMYFVEETMRYAYRIFAAKLIFENPFRYGFVLKPDNLYKPLPSNEVTVSNDIPDLVAFAKEHNITYLDLKTFNPWLRDKKLLVGGKTYTLLIPAENMLYYRRANTYVHNNQWIMQ